MMNYGTFEKFWTKALDEEGILSPYAHPERTVDLDQMDRRYTIRLGLAQDRRAEPFVTSCVLSWRWDALLSARFATTEEDLLTELHGRDEGAEMNTERPWLRADIKLHANLPLGEPQKMPGKSSWRRLVATVGKNVAPLLPVHEIEFNDGPVVLGWCGQPEVRAVCKEDGEVQLAGVALEGYQPIILPRSWSDPDEHPGEGEDLEDQLMALAGRLKQAMQRWVEAVKVLRIVSVSKD